VKAFGCYSINILDHWLEIGRNFLLKNLLQKKGGKFLIDEFLLGYLIVKLFHKKFLNRRRNVKRIGVLHRYCRFLEAKDDQNENKVFWLIAF
jgi:hypothetical protein